MYLENKYIQLFPVYNGSVYLKKIKIVTERSLWSPVLT